MSLRRTIVDHFVTPSGDPRPTAHEDFVPPDEVPDWACAEPAPRTPSGVAVLCGPADAQVLGGALGLALRSRSQAPVVVVCVWTGGVQEGRGAWRGPAVPAVRRLTLNLAARGLDARPAGRLALVRLAATADEAALQACRAAGAAGRAPTVLALGGPRSASFDALLSAQDLVVVAAPSGTDPALARLALQDLASGTVPACVCDVAASAPARALATAGLILLASMRRALARPLEALA